MVSLTATLASNLWKFSSWKASSSIPLHSNFIPRLPPALHRRSLGMRWAVLYFHWELFLEWFYVMWLYLTNQITPTQMEDKVASLHKSFGRVRHSSTGSVKICYSESSNTSMEDVSKNLWVSHLLADRQTHTHTCTQQTYSLTYTSHTHSLTYTGNSKLIKEFSTIINFCLWPIFYNIQLCYVHVVPVCTVCGMYCELWFVWCWSNC